MSTATVKPYTIDVFHHPEGFLFTREAKDRGPGLQHSFGWRAEVHAPNKRSAARRAKEQYKRAGTKGHDLFGQPIPEGFGYEFRTTPEVTPVGGFVPGEMHGNMLPVSSPMPLRPEVQEAFNEAIKEFAPALERLDDSQKVTITTGFEDLDKAMEGGIPVGTFSGRFSTHSEDAEDIAAADAAQADSNDPVVPFKSDSVKLGPTQQKIIDWAGEWCKTNMFFTKAQVIDCLNLTDDSARKSLKRLVDAGLVVKEGDTYNLQ